MKIKTKRYGGTIDITVWEYLTFCKKMIKVKLLVSLRRYKPEYVASKIPLDQHEHQGWFWHMASKKFYRWNDLPSRKKGIYERTN